MKIIFAADSFKGSLTSEEANGIMTRAARAVFGEGSYHTLLIADGGEGTLAAVKYGTEGYEEKKIEVTDPIGNPLMASYLIRGKEAVVEMAEASGLPLVPEEKRNPLHATTKGTGELIRAAILDGARELYIGIGGSATNDGGIGAMTALGYEFLDSEGNILEGYGKDLENIAKINDSQVMKELAECKVTVMCDVKNPLTGTNGATYIFGPQKGAVGEIGDRLEQGMLNYQKVLEDELLGTGLGVYFYLNIKEEENV